MVRKRNLFSPISTLSNTPTINQNLTTTIAINNNAAAVQQSQAVIDTTITTDSGVVLSPATGVAARRRPLQHL